MDEEGRVALLKSYNRPAQSDRELVGFVDFQQVKTHLRHGFPRP